MSTWRYKIDGVKHGPVSGSELRALASRGVITAETLVTKEGLGGWIRARKVPGLIAPPPPASPPVAAVPEPVPGPAADRVEPDFGDAPGASSDDDLDFGDGADASADDLDFGDGADAPDDDDLDFGNDPAEAPGAAPRVEVAHPAPARGGGRALILVACSAAALLALGAAVAYVVLRPDDSVPVRVDARGSSDPAPVPSDDPKPDAEAVASSSDAPADQPAVSGDAPVAGEPDSAPSPTPPDVRRARSGSFTVRVSDWGYREFAGRVTDILTATRASGQFLWFALEVTNEGDSAARIAPEAITLRDAQGRTFEPSDEGMAAIAADHASEPLLSAGNVPWMQSFPPGVAVGVQVIFDVPVQRPAAGGTKADPGHELVLDLGGREATISVSAMRAATIAARDAFNAKFDRLMAAYDEASAAGPATATFEVTFARARWLVPDAIRLPFPMAIQERSCLSFYPGRVGVAANGIVLEPGWQLPPSAAGPDEVEQRRQALGRALGRSDGPFDPVERLKDCLALRTAVRQARAGVQGTWLTTGSVPAGESSTVTVARPPTPQETEAATAISQLQSRHFLIGALQGMKKCAERLDALRGRDPLESSIHARSSIESDIKQGVSDEWVAERYAQSFNFALDRLDAAAIVVEDIAMLSAAVDRSIVEADRDASAAEAAARAPTSFLPFPQGWFLALPTGTLFKVDEGSGGPSTPRTRWSAPVGPQLAGIGTLDGASVAWLASASVEGLAGASPPRAVDAESCLAVIDPFGLPVLMMFASPADRKSFEEALRSATNEWGAKWASTAAEYATLKIGESMQTGARAIELQEQGRSIDIMARRRWFVPQSK